MCNKDAQKLFAVVVPMYNEEAVAQRCVEKISSTLISSGFSNSALIFVVDDGSADETWGILSSLAQSNPLLQLIQHEVNQGYGAALLTGAREASQNEFEYVVFMDSDLTNDPDYLSDFYKLMRVNKFDLIKASRYVKGGGMSGVPLYRKLISRMGNFVASVLFLTHIKDCTNGFRAIRTRIAINMELNERGFASILEEFYILRKQGVVMCEFPNILKTRDQGIAPSKFNYSIKTFWGYLKFPLKYFFESIKKRSIV